MEETSIIIIDKLRQLPPAKPKSYIFKVHHELCAANKEVYEPVLVSIGPYYHYKRKSQLQYMEQHELRCLNDLLTRKEEQGVATRSDQIRKYLGVLEGLEDKARGYYADPVDLKKNDFLEMLLLDGCFIIELFRKADWSRNEEERETDPLFEADWVAASLGRDLTLLENQIPFIVLLELYSMIGDRPDPLDLIKMAVSYLPVPDTLPSGILNREKLSDIKHILDLVRKLMLVEEILEMKDKSASTESTSGSVKKYILDLVRKFRLVKEILERTDESATSVKIPVIQIEDGTEGLFRNLIAYEEHYVGENKYVGDYMSFMDGLVNKPKDVELLRHRGIIESFMGDDEVVAAMFNNMCKHRILSNYY
ncbi:hypothetical protein CDL15_Pgr004611 [Punica granatum]|uniref:Uncharacterized protein n=1 Tax=Punica granatum TaxID=22663 RepID=A0A218WPS2_PUNGR|nr:hypothetical protein CDL15_Pgr004611 [Punica granatum]